MRWCLWFSSVEGWCFQNCPSSCCSFFGCFLQEISCSDLHVFSDRMRRTLRYLTVWLSQAEATLHCPFVSALPSIQPGIDEWLCRLQKGEMYKTNGEGSRNNVLLITWIIIVTVSTTPRVFTRPQENQNWIPRNPDHSNPEASLQTTTRMTGNGLCILKDFFSPSKSLVLQMSIIRTQWGNLVNISSQILNELSWAWNLIETWNLKLELPFSLSHLSIISSGHKIFYIASL